MIRENNSIKPNRLWDKVVAQTSHALNCGALQSIATDYDFIEDNNLRFLVRILSNIERKEIDTKQKKRKANSQGKDFNPFLPYEEDLFVTNLSDTHLCLLNKYNVVDYHLLIITRAFEEQQSYLKLSDFSALWQCLIEIDGLGFYNSSPIAGASQRHKHLQLVPLPLSPEGAKIPIEPALDTAQFVEDIGQIPSFTFSHALIKFNLDSSSDNNQISQTLLNSYYQLLAAIKIPFDSEKTAGDYNLLVTKKWMMMIRRSQPSYQSIGINSLGFAGALLVKNKEQLEQLKQLTPMTILKSVSHTW
ncbi:MAG TPA: phosphorylase [Cyanothece sp. UBA12306]|nr:phosphorylase [Cyanothece sp. UBA12306]